MNKPIVWTEKHELEAMVRLHELEAELVRDGAPMARYVVRSEEAFRAWTAHAQLHASMIDREVRRVDHLATGLWVRRVAWFVRWERGGDSVTYPSRAEAKAHLDRCSDAGRLVRRTMIGRAPPSSASSKSAPVALVEGKDDHGTFATVTVAGIKVIFRFIPAGTFTMGSPKTEIGRFDNETQHEVTISRGYWLAETPVTQALYEAVMDSNPSYYKGADRPVENVSWNDSRAFVAMLNKFAPGLDARLPTEAEWEHACRAGTTDATWIGELTNDYASPNLDGIAVCYANSPSGTQPVRSKAPNPLGLFDMLGNVYEWCEDRFGDYGSAPQTDPRGPDVGSFRVLRGGSWFSLAGFVRAAGRNAGVPGVRGGVLGLRLARGPVR